MDVAQLKLDLETVVRPSGAGLREALARLDALAKDEQVDLPGELRHYLQKRSYAKALAYCEAGESIKTCGGRHGA